MNQDALAPQGPAAEQIAALTWWLFGAGALIFVLVMALLVLAVLRARRASGPRLLTPAQSRTLVLAGGVVIPLVVLAAFVVGSVYVDRSTSATPAFAALTVEVTGHQWWWEVRYVGRDGNTIAVTANEIHVPVGEPVRLLLKSTDVIHSFWVPNLQGKTDLVPGRTNVSWFQADAPGVFRGQCAEFCGMQHAFMAFFVVARPPEEFAAWLARQGEPARLPTDPQRARGLQVFLTSSCMLCHAVRGTVASGRVAPDLTHFASRRSIAAGRLPNTAGHLAGWIADPQSAKPGSRMPATPLDGESLTALVAYLQGLE